MNLPVSIDHERIAEFCRLHHIVWPALFGSILREDFNPESDIDVLVRFDPLKTHLLREGHGYPPPSTPSIASARS